MKKIVFLILLALSLMPNLVVKAEEKEVEYSWYKMAKGDIHYELDAENICEYYDESKYFYTEDIISLTKPEEHPYRVIEQIDNLEIDSKIFNTLEFYTFNGAYNGKVKLKELEIFNDNGEKIEYTPRDSIINEVSSSILNDGKLDASIVLYGILDFKIDFNKTLDISDINIKITYEDPAQTLYGISFKLFLTDGLETNIFALYSPVTPATCNEDNTVCESTYKVTDIYDYNPTLKTIAYKYKDKYTECYTPVRNYYPGYSKEAPLDGYIKDEENYRVITKTESKPATETKTPTETKEVVPLTSTNEAVSDSVLIPNEEEITEELEEPEEPTILDNLDELEEKDKEEKIAFVEKIDKPQKSHQSFFKTFSIIFAILAILFTIILIAKKVVKCQTN